MTKTLNFFRWSIPNILLLFAFYFMACREDSTAPPADIPPGRTYEIHVPKTCLGENAVPLLIALHGYTSTGSQMEQTTQLDAKADTEGFIVVYPDAKSYNGYTMWNAGGMYEVWTNGTDDVGFIASLISKLSRQYNIDKNRVFVTGHSNGAFMTYRIACELSGKIAAIAPVSGQMVIADCYPLHQVSLIHFHALNDQTVPYNGTNISGMVIPPVETVINSWIQKNHCSYAVDTLYKANGILGREWHSADGYGDVALYTNQSSGHNWPDIENAGFSANDVMWNFFKSHPKK